MQTPFVLVSLAFLVFISQQQLSEANCGNGVSNSDEAKCRKDEAPNLIKKNGNRGSSSDSDNDNADGDSDSDSGNSGNDQDDWDSLPDEELVAGTPATRPSGATKKYRQNLYHCDLTDGIRNISVVLDDEQKGRLKDCARKIEHFLQHSFGLSDDKRAAKAAHKLKQCLKKHNDIAKLIRFEKITTWGSIFDVIYMSVDSSAVYVDVIITLDSNDDCDLFEAMRNATEGDAEKESAVLVLIEELKVILLDVSLSMGQKKAKMHDKFKMFFEMHVEWEEFFLEIEIEGFGSLSQFVDVAHGHKQSLSLEVVLSGSSDSDCALCEALTEASSQSNQAVPRQTHYLLRHHH
ncbi:hypothetical protein DdX_22413 [Ditylenchus destructor]|uniref:Secreted protein n=1 Tax=Ditylenchus destructor TaxID=166010 RepID=A0AAD4MFT7_9BILA|nr:hypothetical protein DdX_22413 [Ditylenchus destructor]